MDPEGKVQEAVENPWDPWNALVPVFEAAVERHPAKKAFPNVPGASIPSQGIFDPRARRGEFGRCFLSANGELAG